MCDQGKPTPRDVLDRLRRLLREKMPKAKAARLSGTSRTSVYRHLNRGRLRLADDDAA